jgi:peptide/nickel transport system substrate-binding protein
MHRTLRLALVALATALAVVGSASARDDVRAGGTLTVDLANDVDYTDPALSYLSTGWELEYATCLKLMNYPDANGPRGAVLAPEAAAGYPKVSNGGKTYDFAVNAGFTRFSNGKPVTAADFKGVFDRLADPKMQSPAQSFIGDVTSVRARGKHLIVTLEHAAPDFVARVAMPFFCAVPAATPHDANGVEDPAAAGPYYIASREPNKQIVLKRNPYYKGKRPQNLSQIVYTIGNSLEATRLRVDSAQSDYAAGGIPPSAYAEVAEQYGINKDRFYVRPLLVTSYLALNTTRPLFKDNVPLRKAINYAIDRKVLLQQSGYLAGKRTDQILPPGMAGFRDADLYPLKNVNVKVAQRLAKSHTRDGKIILYTQNRGAAPLRAQILQFNLKQIGLEVEVKQFSRPVQIEKEGTRGEPFDIADESWTADYADPYDFVNVLLDGHNIQTSNNHNLAYFDDPVYNRKMAAASMLVGPKRYDTYGALDVDVMQNAVPFAPRSNGNNRIFVSKRVGCFTYNSIYSVDLAALCLK